MEDIHAVWREVVEIIKDKVTGRTVWETLDAVQPVTREENTVVIGIPHSKSNLLGHLNHSITKNAIETVLSDRLKTRITVRVIDGVTIGDWEEIQKREQTYRAIEEQTLEKRKEIIKAASAWDELHEQVTRKYNTYQNRSLAHVRGQYIYDCIEIILNTFKECGEPDENTERNYARVLERIGSNADTDPAIIGYLVLERKQKSGL